MPQGKTHYVTAKQRDVYMVIHAAKKPCSATFVARQFSDVKNEDARNIARVPCKALVTMGLLRKVVINKRVVHYEAVDETWPKLEVVPRGRRPEKGLTLRPRKTIQTFLGPVTMLDSGELTDGARRVQNVPHDDAMEEALVDC